MLYSSKDMPNDSLPASMSTNEAQSSFQALIISPIRSRQSGLFFEKNFGATGGIENVDGGRGDRHAII
jgi:hypothetical protein